MCVRDQPEFFDLYTRINKAPRIESRRFSFSSCSMLRSASYNSQTKAEERLTPTPGPPRPENSFPIAGIASECNVRGHWRETTWLA